MAWFQVDDQLAMHRKVCEAGNAAMGLWVRAGSWSMANLTEGFVSKSAARMLGTPAQVAALIKAGLWVSMPEGYQFHEWGSRQMSAEQIAERRRKRAEAGRKGGQSKRGSPGEAKPEANASASAQATAEATAKLELKQNGTPVPVPVLSGVTSGGNGTSADARNSSDEPPRRCPKHTDHDDPPPCGNCAEARRANDAWNLTQRRADQQRANDEARQRIESSRASRQAIDACDLCDEDGYIGASLCWHNPEQSDTNARGMAAVRAAIERGGA